MSRGFGSRIPVILLAVVVVTGAVLLWLNRDSLRSPSTLYAEARQASSERARNIYEVLASKVPEIGEYTELWQAEAGMPGLNAFLEIQSLAQYRPNSPVAYLANLDIARYYASIDAEAAEEAYLSALALHDSPGVRLELARFYEERGDNERAYGQYRLLLPVKPDAFEGMRQNATDPLQLAEDLNEATYFSDALEVLRDVDDPEAAQLRGWAHFGLGDYASAVSEIQNWLEGEPQNEEDQFRLAQAMSRLGQIEQALSMYRSIDSADSQLAQAQLMEAVSSEEAVNLYLEVPYPVAWWNATWILEEQGQIEEAIPVYARIAASEAYFGDDAAYRLFVLGDRQHNFSARNQGLSYLQNYGLNWLSQRAGAMATELPAGPAISAGAPEILSKVQALETIGREDLAYLELLFCSRLRRQLNVRVACLQELAERGHHIEAQSIAEEYVENRDKPSISFWQLAYPRPYEDFVTSNAEERGVDPLLVWSVMRVESRYDPHATSIAGARGLMQIIPATQDWIAQQLGVNLSPGDIYVPEINIELGSWYLRYLLDQFEADLDLALTAYNGGASNVEAWLEDPMVTTRDDFIRWIGFGETREYLERVSITYWIYQEIYSP